MEIQKADPRTVSDDGFTVALVTVTDDVLEQLVQAAMSDADADEVTPNLTPGGGWTPARVAWLRSFHRDRAGGLSGPAGEATWAVLVNDRVAGATRLKQTATHGWLEVGIWLTRNARGQGVGHRAIIAAMDEASALGAHYLTADTTAGNTRAITMLRRLGFDLTPNVLPACAEGAVHAVRQVPRRA